MSAARDEDAEVIIISSSSEEEEEQAQNPAPTQQTVAADDDNPSSRPPPPKRRRAADGGTAAAERQRQAEARRLAREEAARRKEDEKVAKRDAKFAERLAAGRLQTREMVVLFERPLGGAAAAGAGGGGGAGGAGAGAGDARASACASACAAALESLDRSTYGIRYAYPAVPPAAAAGGGQGGGGGGGDAEAALRLLGRAGASLAVRFARRPLTAETAGAVPEGTSLELPARELGAWAEPYRPAEQQQQWREEGEGSGGVRPPTTTTAAATAPAPPPAPRGHVPYLLLVYEQPGPFLDHLRRDGGRQLVSLAARAHPRCSLAVAVVCPSSAAAANGRPLPPPFGGSSSSSFSSSSAAAAAAAGSSGANADALLGWSADERRWRELQLLCPALVQLRAVRGPADVAAHVVASAKALARQPYERLMTVSLPWGAGGGGAGGEEEEEEEEAAAPGEAAAAGVEGGRAQGFRACRAVAALAEAQRSSAAALNCVRGVSGARAAAVVERFPSLGALMAAYGVGAAAAQGDENAGAAGGAGGGRGGKKAGGNGGVMRSRYALTCGLRSINAPEAPGVGDSLARKLHHVLTCDNPDELVE